MDRFQLATLANWAGDAGLNGRKRLQKVVYFLKRAGCPLNAEFMLHLYGPYSRDVANVCDDMVAAGLLVQRENRNSTGVQYSYTLAPHTVPLLEASATRHADRTAALARFRDLALELLGRDLGELELGSTILCFQEQFGDWESALRKACEFKKAKEDLKETQAALQLAQRIAKFGEEPVK